MSLRVADPVEHELVQYKARTGWTQSRVLNIALGEWLRIQRHPAIRFTQLPSGQRVASLVDGPEIWTVAESWLDHEPADRTAANIAEATGLTLRQVEAALAYWADYRDDINADLDRVHAAQREARAAWERRQGLHG